MEQKRVKIAVPLKYLSNFWRSLEMSLINCRVELSLKWYETCLLTTTTTATFKITDINCYFISRRQFKAVKTIKRRI